MNRKEFIKKGLLGGASLAMAPFMTWGDKILSDNKNLNQPAFNMKFSPDFNVFNFEGSYREKLEWGYEMGFRAWENTWFMRRTEEEKKEIQETMERLGMEFGQFVGTSTFKDVTFAGRDEALREKVLEDVRQSVEVAKRMNTKYVHNVLGLAHTHLDYDLQMGNAIDLLRRIADIYEPHGITMVMETMNRWNHARMFLYNIPQAYTLAKAVNSPSVKILFDVYHVQFQEGNLLSMLDYVWDEVAYIQIGDVPHRTEPGTGEVNFKTVLQHIHDKGYRGFVGLEHKISREGKRGDELALKAYREIDPV